MAVRIREYDWEQTPLGPLCAWSDRLKVMVEQVLASPLVATLVCGPDKVLVYNAAAARLYDGRHPAALGRPLPETFREGWATVAPFYARAFAGETMRIASQPLDTRGEGKATDIFDALLTPVREANGDIAYVHMTGSEVRERVHAEAALRASEERYRSLFHRMGQGYCELELIRDGAGRAVDQRYIAFNPAFERLFGIQVAEAVGRTASEVFPDLEPWWHDAFDRVLRQGKLERVEHAFAALNRWFEVYVYPADGDRLTVLYEDVTERRRADDALREREERQAFLLRLSDALRAEQSADAVADCALRMLIDKLQLDRSYITIYRLDENRADVIHQVGNDSVPALPDFFVLSNFPQAFRAVHDQTFVIEDDVERQGLSEAEKHQSKALGMRAMVAATLRKGEMSPLWSMVAMSSRPRRWTRHEITLVEEVAERTWAAMERGYAEASLRESEERLRQFGEASSDVLWIRHAETLQWTYLTPAFETIYGLDRETALRDNNMMGWLDLIVPEDRPRALDAIERVRMGERASFEYRIERPSDGSVRWLRNTDFPMRDAAGQVRWLGGVGRDITEEKAAAVRQEVLVKELQHRSRNLIGVVTALSNRTIGRGSPVESFTTRLKALSRAQALLSQSGSDTVAVEALVRAELAAHADGASGRITVVGPTVLLTSQQVQNFALALHELTTNAVKYGALQGEAGRLAITWEVIQAAESEHLALDWIETGVDLNPATVTHRGYGRELIERALAYALGGRTDYMIASGGVRCRIELPLS